MSVLVLGGDDITSIKGVLYNFGFEEVIHWDGRRESINERSIPARVGCLVMLTNYLNHNTMKKFKNEAKKRGLPLVCAKRGASCVFHEFCKLKENGSCISNSKAINNEFNELLKKIFPNEQGKKRA